MDFLNRTRASAALFHTGVAEDRLLASAIVRVLFKPGKDGLELAEEQSWPVVGDPVPTPFGDFEGETPFIREGCDFVVLGNAYASEPRGSATATVSARVGRDHTFTVKVFGDRTWIRKDGRLVASEPKLFQRMPLTWDRSFGGTVPVEGLDYGWPANPKGRGFYWEESQATGNPLPNIENPSALIRNWEDRPDPVGFAPYPKEGALRLLNAVETGIARGLPQIKRVKPSLYNSSIPNHILDNAPLPGEAISITSVRPGGASFEFRLPAASYHTYVQLGDRRYVFPAKLELIAVLAEEEKVLLGYRCCFRYRMVPLERRAAILYSGHCPADPPANYTIDWQQFDAEAAHA